MKSWLTFLSVQFQEIYMARKCQSSSKLKLENISVIDCKYVYNYFLLLIIYGCIIVQYLPIADFEPNSQIKISNV